MNILNGNTDNYRTRFTKLCELSKQLQKDCQSIRRFFLGWLGTILRGKSPRHTIFSSGYDRQVILSSNQGHSGASIRDDRRTNRLLSTICDTSQFPPAKRPKLPDLRETFTTRFPKTAISTSESFPRETQNLVSDHSYRPTPEPSSIEIIAISSLFLTPMLTKICLTWHL